MIQQPADYSCLRGRPVASANGISLLGGLERPSSLELNCAFSQEASRRRIGPGYRVIDSGPMKHVSAEPAGLQPGQPVAPSGAAEEN